ncbi:CrpP-related protein [Achromobacter xylosoxidans]
MHRDEIQKLGAQAARDGLTLWDCPYYRAAAMPGHTGESITEWRGKVEPGRPDSWPRPDHGIRPAAPLRRQARRGALSTEPIIAAPGPRAPTPYPANRTLRASCHAPVRRGKRR